MNKTIKHWLRKIYYLFQSKHGVETRYWMKRYKLENQSFSNEHYKRLMLAMAGETDDHFLHDKVVADFGCGPRGSLCWVTTARTLIGIDVLAAQYMEYFPDALQHQNMLYVTCTEHHIPLPTHYVDVLFTMNALDHVSNLGQMCRELDRIIKPGGKLIGSFNLHHPPHKAEPQQLTEQHLRDVLFPHFTIASWQASAPDESGYPYGALLDGRVIDPKQHEAVLWVRALKKAGTL